MGDSQRVAPRKHLCNKHCPSARPQFALPILWWRAARSACVANQARMPCRWLARLRNVASAHAAAAAAGRWEQRPSGAAPERAPAALRAVHAGRLDGTAHLPHADDTVGVACRGGMQGKGMLERAAMPGRAKSSRMEAAAGTAPDSKR